MRAIVVAKPGPPSVLALVSDHPKPTVEDPECILIKVSYAGVNYIDTYQRDGSYPVPLPFVPGREGSGRIVELGAKVLPEHGLSVGDSVAFLAGGGAYAEYVAVHWSKAVRLPACISSHGQDAAEGLEAEKMGAACLLQGMTAAYLTHDTHPVGPGDSVLVYAAAGGTGALICQMARARGAGLVIGSVGSAGKMAQAGEYCDAVLLLDYGRAESVRDFADRVRDLTAGRGVSVVYDGVGRDTFRLSIDCLGRTGLFVSYGNASGIIEKIDPFDLSPKSLYFTRTALFEHTKSRDGFLRLAGIVFELLERGAIRLRVHKVYPLEDAGTAHSDLQGRQTTGKLLLQIGRS